jgi:hypothetical protein
MNKLLLFFYHAGTLNCMHEVKHAGIFRILASAAVVPIKSFAHSQRHVDPCMVQQPLSSPQSPLCYQRASRGFQITVALI